MDISYVIKVPILYHIMFEAWKILLNSFFISNFPTNFYSTLKVIIEPFKTMEMNLNFL